MQYNKQFNTVIRTIGKRSKINSSDKLQVKVTKYILNNYFNIVIRKPKQQAHTLTVIIVSKKLGTT